MNTVESVGVAPAEDVCAVPSASGHRLSMVVSTFLSEKATELSPYSIAHLRGSLFPLARALGDPPIAAVTYHDLRGYVDGLYLKYKPGTIKPIVGDVRQFFRWVKKKRLSPRNPAKRLKMPSRRAVVESAESKAAPEDDIRRLLDHMAGLLSHVVYRDLFGNLCAAPVDDWSYHERQTVRDLFILSFLYETGARAGELWRLGVQAMESSTAVAGPVYRVISTGKTGVITLRFTSATAELWTVWQSVRPPGSDYAVVGWKPGGLPVAMTTQTISRMISRQCERAGVASFRAHSLRHAKVKRGKGMVGLEITSRLIGHGSAVITAAYAVADESDLNAATLATGLAWRLWSCTNGSS